MLKSVLKEIIIILLLCVAILFILSILFYDYIPINKVVPNKIAYSAPENIREELEEENLENTLSIENKVYTIEGSDLNVYIQSKSYDPSKENPFVSTTTGNGQETVNTNTNTVNTSKNTNTNTNGEQPSKNNTGLK